MNAIASPLAPVQPVSYTKRGLILLFALLLWGDFCLTVMESVTPGLVSLRLETLRASNLLIGLIVTSVPGAINLLLNPIISFASDRHRGRRGRRIPFILGSLPFVTLFLLLLGFSAQISKGVNAMSGGEEARSSLIEISVIAAMVFGFRVADMFVGTVFWYLFNDVVPESYMARFMSGFRIVSLTAIAFYQFALLRLATSHFAEIFAGVALAYFATFLTISLKVREPGYAPVDLSEEKEARSPLSTVALYFRESFGRSIYLWVFLFYTCGAIAGVGSTFQLFYLQSLHLEMGQVGVLLGTSNILLSLLIYPCGMLADRIHPLRTMFIARLAGLVLALAEFIWLFADWSPQTNYLVMFVCTVVGIVPSALYQASAMPLMMRIFPRDRYGQFCSANMIVQSLATIAFGVTCGWVFDHAKPLFHSSPTAYYRLLPVWFYIFNAASLIPLVLLYRQWQLHGGSRAYVPPE